MLLLPSFINQPRGLEVKKRTPISEISGSNPACSFLQIFLKFFVSVFMGSRQNAVPGFGAIHGIITNTTTAAHQLNFLGLFTYFFRIFGEVFPHV